MVDFKVYDSFSEILCIYFRFLSFLSEKFSEWTVFKGGISNLAPNLKLYKTDSFIPKMTYTNK